MKKFLVIFVIILLAIGTNLSDGFFVRYGVHPDFLYIALGAFVIAGLVANEKVVFIVMICLVVIAANLPDDLARSYGYNPDVMLGVLVGLVLIPFLSKHL